MRYLVLLLSLLLVAFGQPYFSPTLSIVGAILGFGLFFQALLLFKKRFLTAALWFATVQLIDSIWFCTPKYHGPMIFLVWILLSLSLGGLFGLTVFVLPKLGRPTLRHALFAASLWAILEFSRYYFFCGFAFNQVGLPWTASLFTLQCVSLFGILGLSFWTIFVGVSFAAKRKGLFLASALLPFIVGAALYYPRKGGIESHKGNLRALLVQTGLRQEQKVPMPGLIHDFMPPINQWGHLLSLIPNNQEFDLVVLPEAVVPFGASRPLYPGAETNGDFAKQFRDAIKSDLLIGLDDSDEMGNYNAAFYYTKEASQRYEKRVLVPLGEYLPLAILRKIAASYGLKEFFTEGKEAKVFGSKVPFSPTICYEECYPHLVRQGRKNGAELFVNLTNDGYYPDSILPKVHFYHGLVRGVENGVPILRACNTGVTASVDSLGRVVDRVEGEWQQKGLTTNLSTYSYQTLYSKLGDYPVLFFSLFVLASLLFNQRKAKVGHC